MGMGGTAAVIVAVIAVAAIVAVVTVVVTVRCMAVLMFQGTMALPGQITQVAGPACT